MPQLAAYYREPVLLGCPLQSALSQSYVASVDPGTDDERNTAAPVGGCSKNLLDKATQETLHRRPDIASESQHTNVDSMLRFVVSSELQGLFGQNQLMETFSRHQSNATFNSQDRNSPYEAKTQARRLLGESALSIYIPGAVTADSSLQRIEPAKEKIGEIARSVSFQFQAGVSLLRGICLQLPTRLKDKTQRRAADQDKIMAASGASSAGDLQLPTVRSASLDAHKTVQAVALEIVGTNIDMNAPLMSAGLDSLSAVEFINALGARIGMDLSPTVLYDHPTLDSLASFLSSELASNEEATTPPREEEYPVAEEVRVLETRDERSITIAAWDFSLAGGITTSSELRSLSMRALTVNTNVPIGRWATPTPGAGPSAAYGSFMSADQLSLDHGSFGIPLAEARSMDPQQSLVLSVGYGALIKGSNSTVLRSSFINSNIGVFVGVEPSGLEKKEASVFSASGGSSSVTSGRLSFSLGLVGPCYSIDVACASSLAALHSCIMTLQGGNSCEEGLGIGTKVLSEAVNYATSVAGMTSARGRCHTFDQRADGYCRGEGCGAFLVRSQSSPGVVILGTDVQQDGPSASLTAPNGPSQRRLIESVSHGIINDRGNSSLEAHGTGTALGDPIEVCYYLLPIQ